MTTAPVVGQPERAAVGECRSCRNQRLELVLDLGLQPVADWLVRPNAPRDAETWYPLSLVLCQNCTLLQLGAFEGEEQIRGHEHWALVSSTVAEHDAAWAAQIIGDLRLRTDSVVAEAEGGGPGLTRALATRGTRTLAAGECAPGTADVVVSNHSLAHALDLDRAVAELVAPLAPDGTVVVEFHHGTRILTDTQFDLISHPHRMYLSIGALANSFARHRLWINEATEIPAYGGSIRIYARRGDKDSSPSIERLLDAERACGLDGIAGHRGLAHQVEAVSTKLRSFLANVRAEGRKVLGYGAPSRASTLLNHCKITTELLPATVDRSIAKQGWALPGCRVPIDPPRRVAELKPDFVLILAWTLAEEIIEQLAEVRSWGGRFVVPLPDLRVV